MIRSCLEPRREAWAFQIEGTTQAKAQGYKRSWSGQGIAERLRQKEQPEYVRISSFLFSPHSLKILFTAQTILLCPQFAFLTPICPKSIQIFIQTKHLSSQGGNELLRACDFQHIVAQEMRRCFNTHPLF